MTIAALKGAAANSGTITASVDSGHAGTVTVTAERVTISGEWVAATVGLADVHADVVYLQQARSTIDEMTSRGGSLVRAQCVSDSLSRRTDGGGEENCAASGYTCSAVEGTCHRQCTTSNDCAGGFVCDTGAARCVVPVTSDD